MIRNSYLSHVIVLIMEADYNLEAYQFEDIIISSSVKGTLTFIWQKMFLKG